MITKLHPYSRHLFLLLLAGYCLTVFQTPIVEVLHFVSHQFHDLKTERAHHLMHASHLDHDHDLLSALQESPEDEAPTEAFGDQKHKYEINVPIDPNELLSSSIGFSFISFNELWKSCWTEIEHLPPQVC